MIVPEATDDILALAGIEEDEDPSPGARDETEELEAEEDDSAEDEEGEEAVEDVAEPMPAAWPKEDQAAWDEMTPAARAVVTRREAEVNKFIRTNGQKVNEARAEVEAKAREAIASQHDTYARELAVFASQFQPQPPDENLLYSGDPNALVLYQRQDAAYRASASRQQQLQQAMAQSQQQADAQRAANANAQALADNARLQEQLPEWFDPATAPALKSSLQSIGAELGYPVELMAEASSTDILALKTAAEWKAKADKFDKLQSRNMETVRAAKGLPKMVKPGVKLSRGAVSAGKRDQAWARVKETKSPDAMADWLESSGIL